MLSRCIAKLKDKIINEKIQGFVRIARIEKRLEKWLTWYG